MSKMTSDFHCKETGRNVRCDISLQCVVTCVHSSAERTPCNTRHGDRGARGDGMLVAVIAIANAQYAPAVVVSRRCCSSDSPRREAIGTAFTRLHNH